MATLGIIRTGWLGTSGGPGLSQIAVRTPGRNLLTSVEAGAATAAMRTYWDSIKALLPNDVSLTVSPVVDMYDVGSGDLVASTTASSAPASVSGTNTLGFSMASGMKMNINTGAIADKRRIRGALYLVPAANAVYNDNGTVLSSSRTTVNTAGDAFRTTISSAGLFWVVWRRKREATANLPFRAGFDFDVTGVETSEKVAILRGRRD